MLQNFGEMLFQILTEINVGFFRIPAIIMCLVIVLLITRDINKMQVMMLPIAIMLSAIGLNVGIFFILLSFLYLKQVMNDAFNGNFEIYRQLPILISSKKKK